MRISWLIDKFRQDFTPHKTSTHIILKTTFFHIKAVRMFHLSYEPLNHTNQLCKSSNGLYCFKSLKCWRQRLMFSHLRELNLDLHSRNVSFPKIIIALRPISYYLYKSIVNFNSKVISFQKTGIALRLMFNHLHKYVGNIPNGNFATT